MKKNLQWLNSNVNKSSSCNFNIYQQRYPVRLPKLKESPEKDQRIFDLNKQKYPDEHMTSTSTTGGLKCVEMPKKTLKDVENLQLEDLLDEDEVERHTTVKTPTRVNMISYTQSDVDSLLNKRNVAMELKQDLEKKAKQDFISLTSNKKSFTKKRSKSLYLESLHRRSPSRRTSYFNETEATTKNSTLEFLKQLQKKKESNLITDLTKLNRTNSSPSGWKNTKMSTVMFEEKKQKKSLNQTRNIEIKDHKEQPHKLCKRNSELRLQENDNTKIQENDRLPNLSTSKDESPSHMDLQNSQKRSEALKQDDLWKLLEDQSVCLDAKRDENDRLYGEPISLNVAKGLRYMLYGCTTSSFNSIWHEQNLVFVKPKYYALKFYKDGPAEIMAVLQAYVIKHLLFVDVDPALQYNLEERLHPNAETQSRSLVNAISDMIWKAGKKKHAVVALAIGRCKFIADSTYREDKVTEKMEIFKFKKRDELEKFCRRNLHLLQNSGMSGCVSLLYSMMLSRGLSNVHKDCAELKHGMMGNESEDVNSRSQALINLCICGRAVPNVFSGNRAILVDEESNLYERQKGVKKRCEVGFLTHKEHSESKHTKVGSCLKTPYYPIWVVHNLDKLCVLFSLKKELVNDWKLERRFDLYHYQGIARYIGAAELDIKLTIDTILPYVENEYEEEDNSTLEEAICTKWNDAVIQWNGYTRF